MSATVKIKVCGVRSLENSLECVEAGTDMLGFNFYPKSKRYIPFDEASLWLSELEGAVERVGLFVNADREAVLRIMDSGFIDVAQFHGDETEDDCRFYAEHGIQFMKAFRVRGEGSLIGIDKMSTNRVLLDAYSPDGYGGTGETFDWSFARRVVENHPHLRVTLSGGLNVDNVEEAVSSVAPWAVDVASGVESVPGVKDPELVRRFVVGALR